MAEPILFLVSRGLLEHKDRMGAAIWEYLWFIDRVTKDEPDGNGKFNGLVLGGAPVTATQIARDLKEHVNTAKANIRALERGGYIVRTKHPNSSWSVIVTNSKKWFWNRATPGQKPVLPRTENCPPPVQEPVRPRTETCPANKEDTTETRQKHISPSSEPKAGSDPGGPKKRTSPQPSQEAVRLAALLKSEILGNKPDYRFSPHQEKNWAQTADRMLRLDGRTEAQIATLIRWVQHDEFWRSNVLSMDKLREKFDALEMKRRASLPVTHKPNGDSHTISNLAPTEPMPAPNPAAVAMTQYKPNGVVKNA